MSAVIRIAFFATFFFALSSKVLANPALEAQDIDAVLNEDYVAEDEQLFFPPILLKRFWSSHPSDFNPMRRPTAGQGGSGRGTKKSETNPYHPVPRSINIGQKSQRSQEGGAEDSETLIEGTPDKRQSPGSFLLMKLGRMNSKNTADVNRRLGRRRV